jgi:hypothetical protein
MSVLSFVYVAAVRQGALWTVYNTKIGASQIPYAPEGTAGIANMNTTAITFDAADITQRRVCLYKGHVLLIVRPENLGCLKNRHSSRKQC